jgi:hypothetical protein
LDGPRIALAFEIDPAELGLLIAIDKLAPFYSADDGFAKEYMAELLKESSLMDFIDPKSASFLTGAGDDRQFDVLVSYDKRRVFVHHDGRTRER